MNDPKRYIWVFIICLGAGIVLMIALLNMDSTTPEEQTLPALGEETRERGVSEVASPVQPRVRPQQPVEPAPIIVSPPDHHEITASVDADPAEGADAVAVEDRIYTMDTLPQDKSGMYWVRDDEGNVDQISVDVPGEDSPIGR